MKAKMSSPRERRRIKQEARKRSSEVVSAPIHDISRSIGKDSVSKLQEILEDVEFDPSSPSSRMALELVLEKMLWDLWDQDAIASLRELARSQGISLSEALRRATATETYMKKEIRRGNRVLVREPNGDLRQVFITGANKPS